MVVRSHAHVMGRCASHSMIAARTQAQVLRKRRSMGYRAGEASLSGTKAKLVEAFKGNQVPSLAYVRASLHRCLCSKHAELRVLQSSLNAMGKSELLQLRRQMLGRTLGDIAALGRHMQELNDILSEVGVVAYVVKSLVQAATPQRQQRRCVCACCECLQCVQATGSERPVL